MKIKRNRVISWTMVILMMAVIFLFSAKTADASEQMSMGVTQWISKLVGISPAEAGGFGNSLYDMLSVMDHYVRKTAHFLEYALLGVLVCLALGIDVKKKAHLLGAALAFCSFYAVTDELHQYFVPGRSCQIKDVMIDSSGALTGICFCMLAGFVLKKIKNKRRNVRQKNTPDVRVF